MWKDILASILWVCIAVPLTAQQHFTLQGRVPGFLEGKTVYLSNKFTDYSKMENPIEDSCRVKNGVFTFKGNLRNMASLVSLYMKHPEVSIKQFFLEGRETTITFFPTSKANHFDSCVFQNAPLTIQQRELELAKRAVNEKMIAFSIREQTAYKTANDSVRESLSNDYRKLRKEQDDVLLDFIRRHPDYYVSLFWFCYQLSDRLLAIPDSAMSVFNSLSPTLRRLPEADIMLQRIENKLALTTTRKLPEFSINDLSGRPVRNADLSGRYWLIDFWASWCRPCLEQLPDLKALHHKFNGKRFSVLGISLDTDVSVWTKAVDKHTLPWRQVSDLKGWESSLVKKLDVRYIPQYYLVAPDGSLALMGVSLQEVQNYLSLVFNPKH